MSSSYAGRVRAASRLGNPGNSDSWDGERMAEAWLKRVRTGFDYQACIVTAFAEKKRGYVKALKRSEMDEGSGHQVSWLLVSTSTVGTAIGCCYVLEKLEAERENFASQFDAATEDEKARATLRGLTLADVKRFLAGIAAQMEAEPELLADAIGSIVDKVVLDPATMEAVVTYKIASLTGNKVASPRGFEPRLPP